MTPVETTSILTWWLAGGLFVAGLVIGAIICGVVLRRMRPVNNDKTAQCEQQFTHYRAEVLRHFQLSSAIVQQLGTEYQYLVERIQQGMHELCKTNDGKPMIPPNFPKTKEHSTQEHKEAVMPKTYVDHKH